MLDQHTKRVAFFLPNTFTALNMACGFIAIMLSIKGQIYLACMSLFLGAVFDSVDGRLARMLGATSAFGEQFDSMSDLVSFGVAPALVFYNHFLSNSGRVGMIATFIYVLCGALRLARFNANLDKISSDYFQGIPIPGAALATIGLVLFSLESNWPSPHVTSKILVLIPTAYLIFYSILMISNFPFPSFKNSAWVKGHKKQVLFIIFLLLSTMFIYEEYVIVIYLSVYVVSSLIYYFFNREKFKGIFNWKSELDQEDVR